ncbi:MAG TPA: T9SS type A sorting domain-containing protein, partial [Puia sp.]
RYAYKDATAQNSPYLYRLKMIDADGQYTYSSTIAIPGVAGPLGLTIFPNPATLSVTVQHPVAGSSARIQVSDGTGRILRAVVPPSGATQTSVDLSGMASGIYQVSWVDSGGVITASLLVK